MMISGNWRRYLRLGNGWKDFLEVVGGHPRPLKKLKPNMSMTPGSMSSSFSLVCHQHHHNEPLVLTSETKNVTLAKKASAIPWPTANSANNQQYDHDHCYDHHNHNGHGTQKHKCDIGKARHQDRHFCGPRGFSTPARVKGDVSLSSVQNVVITIAIIIIIIIIRINRQYNYCHLCQSRQESESGIMVLKKWNESILMYIYGKQCEIRQNNKWKGWNSQKWFNKVTTWALCWKRILCGIWHMPQVCCLFTSLHTAWLVSSLFCSWKKSLTPKIKI